MTEEELIDELMSVVTELEFKPAVADGLLKQLQSFVGPHPFEECDPLPAADGDFLGFVITSGTIPAVKWAIERQVMNPPDLDMSLYTPIALLEPDFNADPEMGEFLLKTYGCSFSEIPYGDLPSESQELVIRILGDEEIDE